MILSAELAKGNGHSRISYIHTEFTDGGLPIIRGQIIRICRKYPDEGILLIPRCAVCGCQHFHGWELKNDHHIVEARTAHCAGLNGIWYHVSVFPPGDWRYPHVIRPGKQWRTDAKRKGLRT